jgi:hypothetical protein
MADYPAGPEGRERRIEGEADIGVAADPSADITWLFDHRGGVNEARSLASKKNWPLED